MLHDAGYLTNASSKIGRRIYPDHLADKTCFFVSIAPGGVKHAASAGQSIDVAHAGLIHLGELITAGGEIMVLESCRGEIERPDQRAPVSAVPQSR